MCAVQLGSRAALQVLLPSEPISHEALQLGGRVPWRGGPREGADVGRDRLELRGVQGPAGLGLGLG